MLVGVGQAAPLAPSHSASSASARKPGHLAVLLGNRTIHHAVGRTGSGQPAAFPFAVRRAGTVSAVSVYLDAHNKARTLMVALYSSRRGHPVKLVASGKLSSPKAGSWNRVSLGRVAVRARSTYWLAVLGRGGTLVFRDARHGSCQARMYRTRMASMPRRWTSATRMNACSISAYAMGHLRPGAGGGGGGGTTNGTLTPTAPTAPTSPGGPGSPGTPAAQVGAPTPLGALVCTQTLNAGANVQSVVSSAAPGAVVCLNPGNWSPITLSGIAPASPGVTLAAPPGQTVVVPGFTVTGSNTRNLTIEGFNITKPGSGSYSGNNTGIQLLCGISGGVSLRFNTIENQSGGYGVYSYPDSCGGGHTQTGIDVEYNQIDHVSTGMEIDGNGTEQFGWTIAHNVIGPYIQYGGDGHYIQIGGISGPVTINNNAFEGPSDPAYETTSSHLNVLHIFNGGTNVTFDNNIIWHSDARAQSVLIADEPLQNINIQNNLDVEDPACETDSNCYTSPYFVEGMHGLTFEHNTSVNAAWSIILGHVYSYTYSDPQNMTATYNLTAPVSGDRGETNYGEWNCTSSCTTGNNVSADSSASGTLHGSGNIVNWAPTWTTTSWTPVSGPGYQAPPPGYYQPPGLLTKSGSSVLVGAGYQGLVGP
jgi:hypothetical protein